ncbi:MAG: PASTA domain-containing protein [Clostridiales bacterium]|nr:PASTA domain-containing protein [Clostridiales bacterium]
MKNYNNKRIKERAIALLLIFCICFGALTLRLGYIQLVWADDLRDLAIDQWLREINIYPKRGTITDTNGVVLAQSISRDSLQATPNDIDDPEAVAKALAPILDIEESVILEKISNTSKAMVWVKRLLTREESNAVKALMLKGIDLIEEPARVYPNGNLASQVLGFTMMYADVDGHAGQEGIEQYYNEQLIGLPGSIMRETDNSGKEIAFGDEIYVPATDGSNVVLTIDATIQYYLESAATDAMTKFQAKGVYAVAMDPNTGAILAMVNKPDFDCNDPPRDLTITELQKLVRNNICKMNYDPGSTFKPIVVASALEEGTLSENASFYCPGYRIIDGQRINCFRTWGHGHQSVADALCNSCNPALMDIGLKMGKENLFKWIRDFGFGDKTGIDVSGEEKGILLNEDSAKTVDVARMSFGQALSVTPIQLASAFSALVNGGKLYKPYLLKSITQTTYDDNDKASTEVVLESEPVLTRQVISEKTSKKMRDYLKTVVDRGGGKNATVEGFSIGGKSGTASKYTDAGTLSEYYTSSFIAYGPYENPRITVLFIVDEPHVNGYTGSAVAAPYVGDFLEDVFAYWGLEPTKEIKSSVKVPKVTKMDAEDAVLALEALGLEVNIEGVGTYVLSQSISSGTKVTKGTEVTITLTDVNPDREGQVCVPDVYGMNILEANEALKNSGLKLEVSGAGFAAEQSVVAGSWVDKGATVTVTFQTEL